MLMRWQKELEENGYQSIYFNAWEDDFCDDPLVAIVGQLENSLKGSRFKEIKNISEKIKSAALPLITENILSILAKQIGVTISSELLENMPNQILEKYSAQNQSKIELKKQLVSMAEKVKDETNHPFIFIIDELDRCRPTFAIELLERVKHIFAIPNMVFVFGINRNELCAAVKSVYGEIDADVYIRRFFDMEFTLPEPNAEEFCKNLIVKYELDAFFSEMSKFANHGIHKDDFNAIDTYFPLLCSHFNLSLRDIEHCVTSMAFASRNIKQRDYMLPLIVSILIILRLKNNSLYRDFFAGKCLASKVINYVDQAFQEENVGHGKFDFLYTLRAQLYCMDKNDYKSYQHPTLRQLQLLCDGEELSQPEYLSDRIKTQGKEDKDIAQQQCHRVMDVFQPIGNQSSKEILQHIHNLIEISSLGK